VTAADAQAEAAQGPVGHGPIVLGRPAGPTQKVMQLAASCGADRYSVTLDGRYRDSARRLGALTANGRELDRPARNEILRHLTAGMAIMDATIDQCLAEPSPRARFRLTIAERRGRTISTRFFDFLVAPDGGVSGLRFN
jgi:hypothetical protein